MPEQSFVRVQPGRDAQEVFGIKKCPQIKAIEGYVGRQIDCGNTARAACSGCIVGAGALTCSLTVEVAPKNRFSDPFRFGPEKLESEGITEKVSLETLSNSSPP